MYIEAFQAKLRPPVAGGLYRGWPMTGKVWICQRFSHGHKSRLVAYKPHYADEGEEAIVFVLVPLWPTISPG